MAQSFGEMDLDQDFDYDLEGDDLLIIEQTEQIYLNTQQSQQVPVEYLRNEPTNSTSWNPAQEAVGSVNWNPSQEIINLEEEEIVIAESNINTTTNGTTTTSRFDPEVKRKEEYY